MNARTVDGSGISFDHYRRYIAAVNLCHEAIAAEVGLEGADFRASNVLDLDGPMTNRALAERLGRSPAATTRLVDRLIRAGLARRTTDPDDRRRAVIEHTGALPDGIADRLDEVRQPIALVLANLTAEQRSGVAAYLAAASDAYADASRPEPAGTVGADSAGD